MKSIVICVILSMIVVGVCLGGIIYVNQATAQLEDCLQRCLAQAEAENFVKATATLGQVQTLWAAKRPLLMTYVDQTLLDEIEDHLTQMEALVRHHKEEFVPTGVLCINKCRELRQRESISRFAWF